MGSSLRDAAAAVGLLLGLTAVSPAEAQTAPASAPARKEPSAADRETARQLVAQGNERFLTGDYRGALEAYAVADQLVGVPTTALLVGRAQERLGLLLEARDSLLRSTRHAAVPGEPPAFASAREDAAAESQAIAARIPKLRFVLLKGGAPVDKDTPAQVTVDREPIEGIAVRLPRSVNPGRHVVRGYAPALASKEVTVTVREAETKEVRLELEPSSEGLSTAGAAAPTPAPTSASAGPTAPPKPDATASPEPDRGISPFLFVGAGIAGAGLIAGTVTGIVALDAASDAKAGCQGDQCPVENEEHGSRSDTFATLSTVSFAVAAVGAGIGVYGLVATLSGGSSAGANGTAGARLEPVVGPGHAGLRGRF
jgi:hypothetical protein